MEVITKIIMILQNKYNSTEREYKHKKIFACISLFDIGINSLLFSKEIAYVSTITKKPKWHKGTTKELRFRYESVHNAKYPLSAKYY